VCVRAEAEQGRRDGGVPRPRLCSARPARMDAVAAPGSREMTTGVELHECRINSKVMVFSFLRGKRCGEQRRADGGWRMADA